MTKVIGGYDNGSHVLPCTQARVDFWSGVARENHWKNRAGELKILEISPWEQAKIMILGFQRVWREESATAECRRQYRHAALKDFLVMRGTYKIKSTGQIVQRYK